MPSAARRASAASLRSGTTARSSSSETSRCARTSPASSGSHKPWGLDLVAFFDAGRFWADWSPQPQLDGTGLGLKYGTGLGIRMIQGTALVVRGDMAWSPDAEPIGGYFAAGEMF